MTVPVRFLNVNEVLHVDNALLLSSETAGFYDGLGKRALDIALVLMTAAVSVPLILFMAFLVMLDGHAPFYLQRRIGRGGKTFWMWKLRSMRMNSEEALHSQLRFCAESAREWEINQKLRMDPRVTPVGRLLRETSLDELPQLWNVLKGDMSLVGPRPMMVEQQSLYPGTEYFRMRPGLTGLWQVSGRNSTSFEARALFDATYAAKQSLSFDLLVMARTVGAVLARTGY